MKITSQYERLHTGEHLSRVLSIDTGETSGEFTLRLAFVTPSGQIFMSDELSHHGGKAYYELPSRLLDGKGELVCQAAASFADGRVLKSDCIRLPVKESIDSADLPEVSAESVKGIYDIFDMMEQKADKVHSHREYLPTEEAVAAGSFVFDGYYSPADRSVKNITQGLSAVSDACADGKSVFLRLDISEHSGTADSFVLLPLTCAAQGDMVFEKLISAENGAEMISVRAFSGDGGEEWSCDISSFDPSGAATFRFLLNLTDMSLTSADGKSTQELFRFIVSGGSPDLIIEYGECELRASVTDKPSGSSYNITAYDGYMNKIFLWSLEEDALRYLREFSFGELISRTERLEHYGAVDSGTQGLWSKRVYADGYAECFCRLEIRTDINTGWDDSGFYVSDTIPSEPIAFPFEFESVPVVTAIAEGQHSVFLINGSDGNTETTLGSFHLARPFQSLNVPFVINISVKGKLRKELS